MQTPNNLDAAPEGAAVASPRARHPASARVALPLAVGVLAISAGLLFYDLGEYPLWSDEADTALFARSIARTGDTSAVLDQNIIAFRHGAQLVNLRERMEPPAPFYLAAPFVGREGTGAFWPRFPFVVCGLLTIGLIVYWLWRDGADLQTWVVLSLGLVSNVSLMLYLRQCRYYALAMLVTSAAAYWYLHAAGRRRYAVLFSVAAVLLLLSHYLLYAGLFVALGVDYLLFERKRNRLSWPVIASVLLSQAVFVILALWSRYPFDKELIPHVQHRNWFVDRLILFWWNLRDMNACEYGVGLLMLAAPLVYLFIERNVWLLRASLAIVTYTIAVTIFSPQPVGLGESGVADIRYLSALIPLCIYLTALVVLVIGHRRWAIVVPLAALAFCTNVLNQPLSPVRWRSTSFTWLQELRLARPTAVGMVIDLLNQHVKPDESVLVGPSHLIYPLMYHFPRALYAWQLLPPPAGQFEDLPSIHFVGLVHPDYIVSFGGVGALQEALAAYRLQGIHYGSVKVLDIYWDDHIRPELFWHRFAPRVNFRAAEDGVHFYRRRQ